MPRIKLANWVNNTFPPIWEEPPTGDPPASDPPASDPPAGDPTLEASTFSKEEVEKLLTGQKQATEDRIKKVTEELKAIQQNKTVTEKTNQQLQEQLDNLRKSLMTKEELSAEQQAQMQEQYRNQVNDLTSERDTWKTQFEAQMVDSAILSNATDSWNPQQFLSLLKPLANVRPTLNDEGEPTGGFEVRISLDNLDLSVEEAVQRMKDNPDQHGNLFKSGLKPGLGMSPSGGKAKTLAEIAASGQMSDWSEHRKQLGLS